MCLHFLWSIYLADHRRVCSFFVQCLHTTQDIAEIIPLVHYAPANIATMPDLLHAKAINWCN